MYLDLSLNMSDTSSFHILKKKNNCLIQGVMGYYDTYLIHLAIHFTVYISKYISDILYQISYIGYAISNI